MVLFTFYAQPPGQGNTKEYWSIQRLNIKGWYITTYFVKHFKPLLVTLLLGKLIATVAKIYHCNQLVKGYKSKAKLFCCKGNFYFIYTNALVYLENVFSLTKKSLEIAFSLLLSYFNLFTTWVGTNWL